MFVRRSLQFFATFAAWRDSLAVLIPDHSLSYMAKASS
jgi:hypothetical protein